MTIRIAIDIGGTFTDIVLEASGSFHTHKLLTTQSDPSEAVVSGFKKVLGDAGIKPNAVDLVIHGTTLATNAIIERKGARTGLITTEGHRDVIEIALEHRFEQYDVNIDLPKPLVPRQLRLPVKERMDFRGNVLVKLDMSTLDVAIDELARQKVESIAVGFLHAYTNGSHEEQVRERLAQRLPNVPISLSSEVCPEIREYERLSTTTANAYVLPMMSSYLTRLNAELELLGCNCPLLMMTSGGGLTTLDTAAKFPIRLVESGPAGGAILAADIARRLGIERVLSFDMGGTTAKLCTIDNFEPETSRAFEVDRRYRFKKGSGLPVRIPVIEMVEIGAGGGSIAWVDQLRRINVGPESAGSEPGPACYGRGGGCPTVTDADALMGRLDPERFAGGRIPLDLEAAEKSVKSNVVAPLGLALDTALVGIVEMVGENMASAARRHAAEMGSDVEGRTLIAFGGAAPLHAAELARKLGLNAVIVPSYAGVGSAVGFLRSHAQFEVVASHYMLLSEVNPDRIASIYAQMRSQAIPVVRSASHARLTERARAYMRYVGQGYEIPVAFDPNRCAATSLQVAFDQAYLEHYGRLLSNAEVEVMSWTLTVSAAREPTSGAPPLADVSDYLGKHREVRILEGSRWTDARQIERTWLCPGERLTGPAVIVEDQTSTVVPSGFEVKVGPEFDLYLQAIEMDA